MENENLKRFSKQILNENESQNIAFKTKHLNNNPLIENTFKCPIKCC